MWIGREQKPRRELITVFIQLDKIILYKQTFSALPIEKRL